VLLVDARNGLLTQTHRHNLIVALMGIRHIVLTVNKMELGSGDLRRYRWRLPRFGRGDRDPRGGLYPDLRITGRERDHAERLNGMACRPALVEHLESVQVSLDRIESVQVSLDRSAKPFRMPVQWVNSRTRISAVGLYKLARAGTLPNLTGITSPYAPAALAEQILDVLREKGIV